MILLVDNYDSFSYNLYQLIGSYDEDIRVYRNDEITIADIRNLSPGHIILSPGPGRPEDAGICIELVRELYDEYPILGVCLGHQAICSAFGGKIVYAEKLMHGKQSLARLKDEEIFKGINKEINVARYHSLAAERDSLPDVLKVIGSSEGEVMAVKHKIYPVYGLQFHPESIMTPDGKKIVSNFLEVSRV